MATHSNSIRIIYFASGVLLLCMGFVMGLLLLPFSLWGDGIARIEFMDSLIHHLKITPIRYSMIGPLFSLPLWWISRFFTDSLQVIIRYNYLLFAIFLVIIFFWLRGWYDHQFVLTFIVLLAFGSMFPGHLLNYYGEVFSAVCLTLGSLGLVAKKTAIGWVFLVLAVLNTPALYVAFALLVLYTTWHTKRFRYLLLLPICAIMMIIEGAIRMGSLTAEFQTYLISDHGFQTLLPFSGRAGFSYPFILGVLSILLSFGKGLFFFCPGLLLIGWAWKLISDPMERKLLVHWLLIVFGLIGAYAAWWAWYGGWYWGPRFFLFASVPAAWILAKMIHARSKSLLMILLIMLIVTLTIWVGVNGVVFQQKTLDICTADNYALESLCWYVPEFSVLIRPFITHATFQQVDVLFLAIFALSWLYLMFPLGLEFTQQLRVTYKTYRPQVDFSAWKL